MALLLYSTAVKQYIITTTDALRTESDHAKKPQLTKSLQRKKKKEDFSIGKNEAKKKRS